MKEILLLTNSGVFVMEGVKKRPATRQDVERLMNVDE